MKKHTILFLAANPIGTDRIALDREARAIRKELESAGLGDCFELETRWAVEPLDLLRELRRLKPTVVHFSGHGGERGLMFQNASGRSQIVTTEALVATVGAAGASVRLVVLNACYSESHADALLAHVDCVVGTDGPILDTDARNFAIGFYGGLGEREPVAAAFAQGRAAISLGRQPGGARRDAEEAYPDLPEVVPGPRLKVRPGVDASRLFLSDPR